MYSMQHLIAQNVRDKSNLQWTRFMAEFKRKIYHLLTFWPKRARRLPAKPAPALMMSPTSSPSPSSVSPVTTGSSSVVLPEIEAQIMLKEEELTLTVVLAVQISD